MDAMNGFSNSGIASANPAAPGSQFNSAYELIALAVTLTVDYDAHLAVGFQGTTNNVSGMNGLLIDSLRRLTYCVLHIPDFLSNSQITALLDRFRYRAARCSDLTLPPSLTRDYREPAAELDLLLNAVQPRLGTMSIDPTVRKVIDSQRLLVHPGGRFSAQPYPFINYDDPMIALFTPVPLPTPPLRLRAPDCTETVESIGPMFEQLLIHMNAQYTQIVGQCPEFASFREFRVGLAFLYFYLLRDPVWLEQSSVTTTSATPSITSTSSTPSAFLSSSATSSSLPTFLSSAPTSSIANASTGNTVSSAAASRANALKFRIHVEECKLLETCRQKVARFAPFLIGVEDALPALQPTPMYISRMVAEEQLRRGSAPGGFVIRKSSLWKDDLPLFVFVFLGNAPSTSAVVNVLFGELAPFCWYYGCTADPRNRISSPGTGPFLSFLHMFEAMFLEFNSRCAGRLIRAPYVISGDSMKDLAIRLCARLQLDVF